VLADVLGRDGQERSATEVLRQNLADADHLAILHAIWVTETAPYRDQRYRDLLTAVLPASYSHDLGPKERWLCRTLRAAELAGLDPARILADAVGRRSLSDARDIAAVIDARIRQRIRGLVPKPAQPWSAQVPELPDPQCRAYITDIAAAMDERKERIGEHAAEHELPWAVNGLGPVPDDPADRLDWQQRASAVGAYRELYGYQHPAEPIGPEPAADSPDKRAAWHEAFAALRLAGDAQVRAMPDGQLLHHRAAYPIDTAWAPAMSATNCARSATEPAPLASPQSAPRPKPPPPAATAAPTSPPGTTRSPLASYRATTTAYEERVTLFAAIMDDRKAWEQATADRRRLAVAADAELRRCHPGQHFPPLRSAEPELLSEEQRAELTLTPDTAIPEAGPWLRELAADREVFGDRLAQAKEQDMQKGPAPRSQPAQPLLQPPMPEIKPSARVLERAGQRQAELEAGG
jgi:hypothetical protein